MLWTAEFLLQLTDDWFAKKADFLLQPVENWFAKKEKSQQDEVFLLVYPINHGGNKRFSSMATKPQGTFSGKYIDGRVDPNYSTIKKLRSHLAPKWVHFQTIIENKRISNKTCCI